MKFKFVFTLIIASALFTNCNNSNKPLASLNNPASENSMYPYLEKGGDQLFMSWINETNSESSLNMASFDGTKWSPVQTMASDSTWFVNWADYPSVTANDNGVIGAHWLNKKTGGTYSYDVNIAFSNDWENVITPHKDETATEHGFVSMIPWKNGNILAVWLDGRQTANRADDEYYNIDYAMTLRGAIISSDGKIQKKFLIDDSVCDCCQTTLTKTANGAIVAYRNRTDNEIRDIYVSRFDGEAWSQPQNVYADKWNIGACPVNGPKIVAEGSNVTIAWYTGAGDAPKVKTAFSKDDGVTFSDPLILNKNKALGRVDAVIQGEKSYISWMEKGEKEDILKVALVKNEKKITEKTIGNIKGSRSSGFPQMEMFKRDLIFAWTKVDSASTGIITKKLKLPF